MLTKLLKKINEIIENLSEKIYDKLSDTHIDFINEVLIYVYFNICEGDDDLFAIFFGLLGVVLGFTLVVLLNIIF